LRKLAFDENLLSLILTGSLDSRPMDHVLGVSELLFEVAYGASEGLHSKAKEVIS